MERFRPSPLDAPALVEAYFLENRTRLLDIAAFLDRLDRAEGEVADDFRVRAFKAALSRLAEGGCGRVEDVQMLLSDPRSEPLSALDRKSATGAYDRWKEA